jgi:hypothetical protein
MGSHFLAFWWRHTVRRLAEFYSIKKSGVNGLGKKKPGARPG